jgi:hypothetical protein
MSKIAWKQSMNGGGGADRWKLVSLVEALKQLELGNEFTGMDGENTKSSNHHNGVLITTVKSLDPRVPDFQLPRIAESKNKTERLEEPERHQAAESDLSPLL